MRVEAGRCLLRPVRPGFVQCCRNTHTGLCGRPVHSMERNACGPILEQGDFVTVVVGRRSRDLLEEAADWKKGKVDWRPGSRIRRS